MSVRQLAIGPLLFYKRFVSPLLPPACRFHPTCSEYAMDVIRIYGLGKGSWLSLRRLLRCHPFSAGGYDPPPAPAGKGH